jgi:alpha-L-rhamnosidase
MNSFSHYAFGAVMEWGFKTLAGIDTIDPGYARIRIRPRPPAPGSNPERTAIDWARADYESPRGPVQSHWRRFDGGIEMRVRIPANATAVVHVPARDAAGVMEGDGLPVPVGRVPGVKVLEAKDGEVLLEVGSGEYRFLGK